MDGYMSDVSRHGSPAGRGVSQCAICASLGTWKPQLLRAVIGFSLSRLAVLIALPLTLGAQGNNQSKTEDKRILWIFTNHRTAEESANLPKLTPKGKFSNCVEGFDGSGYIHARCFHCRHWTGY